VEDPEGAPMFSRFQQGKDNQTHKRSATSLLVTAKAVKAIAVGPFPASSGDLRIALLGDTTLSWLTTDGKALQERFRARDSKVAELIVPAPLDGDVLAQFATACSESRIVDVYAEYHLHDCRAIALETLTMVGNGIYVDLGARNVVIR
jgi:hypothetical protein